MCKELKDLTKAEGQVETGEKRKRTNKRDWKTHEDDEIASIHTQCYKRKPPGPLHTFILFFTISQNGL